MKNMEDVPNKEELLDMLIKEHEVVQDAIIDLYLQVKVRTDDEDNDLKKEKQRLQKLDSLTVIDYIRSSIEIMMQIRQGDKDKSDTFSEQSMTNSEASTVRERKSIPKEYESQLVAYEAEVRNHIKLEQQLKLHIEQVHDKIQDMQKQFDKEKADLEQKAKKYETQLTEAKQQLNKKSKQIETLQLDLDKIKSQLTEEFANRSKSPEQLRSTNQNQQQRPQSKSPYLTESIHKLFQMTGTMPNQGRNDKRSGSSVNSSKSEQHPDNISIDFHDKMKTMAAIQRLRKTNIQVQGNTSNIQVIGATQKRGSSKHGSAKGNQSSLHQRRNTADMETNMSKGRNDPLSRTVIGNFVTQEDINDRHAFGSRKRATNMSMTYGSSRPMDDKKVAKHKTGSALPESFLKQIQQQLVERQQTGVNRQKNMHLESVESEIQDRKKGSSWMTSETLPKSSTGGQPIVHQHKRSQPRRQRSRPHSQIGQQATSSLT